MLILLLLLLLERENIMLCLQSSMAPDAEYGRVTLRREVCFPFLLMSLHSQTVQPMEDKHHLPRIFPDA